MSFLKYFSEQNIFDKKPYSEKTAEKIDVEVKEIVDVCYQKSKDLLLKYKDKVEMLAEELLKREIIYKDDVEKILGKRSFENNE